MKRLVEYVASRTGDEPVLIQGADLLSAQTILSRVAAARSDDRFPPGRSYRVIADDDLEFVLGLLAADGWALEIILGPEEGEVQDSARFSVSRCGAAPSGVRPELAREQPCDTQWLLATSGTTGTPKWVPHSLGSLTRTTKTDAAQGADLRWGLLYDPRRFAGLQVVLQALLGGSCLVLPSDRGDFGRTLEEFRQHRVNAISGTPSLWRKLLLAGVADRLDLRIVTLGGEIADAGILKTLRGVFPGARISHIYASTEAGVGFAVSDGEEGFPASYLEGLPGGVELKVDGEGGLYVRRCSSGRDASSGVPGGASDPDAASGRVASSGGRDASSGVPGGASDPDAASGRVASSGGRDASSGVPGGASDPDAASGRVASSGGWDASSGVPGGASDPDAASGRVASSGGRDASSGVPGGASDPDAASGRVASSGGWDASSGVPGGASDPAAASGRVASSGGWDASSGVPGGASDPDAASGRVASSGGWDASSGVPGGASDPDAASGRVASSGGRDASSGVPGGASDPDAASGRVARSGGRDASSRGTPLADEEGWICTGDLVEKRGDRYCFLGRANGAINVGGNKVHPTEIEDVARTVPGVVLAVARARHSPIVGQVPELLIEADRDVDAATLKDAVLERCRAELPRVKWPAVVKVVDELALSDMGKVTRRVG